MRRPWLLALAIALLALPIAGPAAADEEEDPRVDPRTLIVEIWSAMGSADVVREESYGDPEFMFMTGVLGLARFAPFEVGLTVDVGSAEEENNVLFGPVFGLGIDFVPGFRAEGLLEFGGHLVDGIGYDWAFEEEGASGDRSKWLFQGGLRIGLSARIGRDTPRAIVGGWIAVYRDFTTEATTITDSYEAVQYEVGGSMGLIALRFGFEW